MEPVADMAEKSPGTRLVERALVAEMLRRAEGRISSHLVVAAMACGDAGLTNEVLAAFGGANRLDTEGHAPIHRACSQGLMDVLHELLRRGADVDRREARGWTPLHRAILQEDVAMARELIVFGADVNAMGLNDDPRPPLLMAAFVPDMLALLLAAGAKLPRPRRDGTIVDIAGGIEARVSPAGLETAKKALAAARARLFAKARHPVPAP